MASASRLEMTLLAGTRALLSAHGRELPQRDDLCGAFCGALALSAAGIERHGSEPIDQDAVALAAGSVVSAMTDPLTLPRGERGRRDYRLKPPVIEDPALSGTTAAGLVRAIGELSGGELAAIPLAGPWTVETLTGAFAVAAASERPVTLVVNMATRQLWGGRAQPEQLLGYLLDGSDDGPAPDWDVGHFACLIGRVHGPGGSLYGLADTYPSLGSRGIHLQPQERLVSALQRPGMAPGGMIAVACAPDAPTIRSGVEALGLTEELWDNGTLVPEMLR